MSSTIILPLWVLSVVQVRLARLVKIATKLGVEAPALIVGEPFTGPIPAMFQTRREAEWAELSGEVPTGRLVEVATVGASPVLPGGWQVLASVDHDPAGNLVACSPVGQDQGLAHTLLHAEPTCDHCGLSRQRGRTIVLANEAGEVVRVGSTCLKSFLGYHGEALDSLWTLMAGIDTDVDVEDPEVRQARINYGDPFLPITAAAFAVVRTCGFVKSQPDSFRAIPTRQRVADYFYATAAEREQAIPGGITEADVVAATEAVAWLLHNTDTSDYITNLRTLAVRDAVKGKDYGLAVSLPQARKSAAQREAEQAARQARQEAQGEPGLAPTGKATVEGIVLRTDIRDGQYGPSYKLTLQLDNGARVWGTIARNLLDQDGGLAALPGARIRFSATFEASDKPDFAFYQRPTKAVILVAAP